MQEIILPRLQRKALWARARLIVASNAKVKADVLLAPRLGLAFVDSIENKLPSPTDVVIFYTIRAFEVKTACFL